MNINDLKAATRQYERAKKEEDERKAAAEAQRRAREAEKLNVERLNADVWNAEVWRAEEKEKKVLGCLTSLIILLLIGVVLYYFGSTIWTLFWQFVWWLLCGIANIVLYVFAWTVSVIVVGVYEIFTLIFG